MLANMSSLGGRIGEKGLRKACGRPPAEPDPKRPLPFAHGMRTFQEPSRLPCSSPVDALSSRRPASAIVSSLICAKPPSTKSSAQLTKLLSSEARNTTAFATTYGSVRSILDNKIDRQTAQQPPTNGVPILHPNIRGPRYYH